MLAELKGKPEGESLSDAEAFAVEISDLRKIDSRLQVVGQSPIISALQLGAGID